MPFFQTASDVPLPQGAIDLGCRGCCPRTVNERGRRAYCATCPVTVSRETGELHLTPTAYQSRPQEKPMTQTTYQPGDILLVKNFRESKISDLIMAGERAEYGDTEYAEWTHAALIVSPQGDLVEALSDGIKRTHILKYKDYETFVISPTTSQLNRTIACLRAEHFAEIHTKYSYLGVVSLGVQVLTGWNLMLHNDTQFFCSALVARCCDNYVILWPKSYEAMMPADLAHFYDIHAGLKPEPLDGFSRVLDKLRALVRKLV